MNRFRYIQARPFSFMVDDELLFEADRIGIFYTKGSESCVMHKHGNYADVERHYIEFKTKIHAAGFIRMANEARLIDVTNGRLDDLNHLINTSALPEKYFLKLTGIVDI